MRDDWPVEVVNLFTTERTEMARLAHLIAGSERQRAVLVLRFYEDLPEAEIAEILGCRVGTVKPNLHRALQKLRREL